MNGGTNPGSNFEYLDQTLGHDVDVLDMLHHDRGLPFGSRVICGSAGVGQIPYYCNKFFAQDDAEPVHGKDYLIVVVGADFEPLPEGRPAPAGSEEATHLRFHSEGSYSRGGKKEVHNGQSSRP